MVWPGAQQKITCELAVHADAPDIRPPEQNSPSPHGGGTWHCVPRHACPAGHACRVHCCDDG